mmetsp:Transcript_15687/g.47304  ORF Transcript_15687/g.47304 Transcript_15687/m.47304 type:complete len:370 (-) Transcript_15687:155-1264(-)|eukprot:CAMPEP_0206140680 /NCGR_PEP_ID=MMETSP1473-20131121/10307_1 /ASSEMBLY_ACC=CAM_ASM_001109 /TAXON_ID=1461547 /ORGANISM="Stichococcus sp, Strain RCC1054" /LENGTH=369 /DNA_ID=CAMNT_0053534919 /DNA_START=438 /DNA_END=1547 /DNA_ORIENTATION=+
MNGRNGSQAASSSGDELSQTQGLFIVHKLSKFDTLAGLAVRYHVTVSDIKRSNSLLSDSAMFARDSLLIPTRPLPMGLEYSAWAGMIVTQYGQISRTSQDRDSFTGSSSSGPHNPQRASAIDQLRAHYGLTPSTSPTEGRGRASSEDGFASHRPGEVEMQDLFPTRAASRPLPRGPSLPELVSYAGARDGAQSGDERLRRRQTGDEFDSWDAAEPSGSSGGGSGLWPSGSGSLQGSQGLPPAGSSSPDRSRRRAPAPSSPGDPAHLRSHSSGGPPLPRRSPAGPGPLGPGPSSGGRQRESLFDKVKRVASQPQLAISAASNAAAAAAARVADGSASVGMRRPPGPSRSRSLLQEAAAAMQPSKELSKKE